MKILQKILDENFNVVHKIELVPKNDTLTAKIPTKYEKDSYYFQVERHDDDGTISLLKYGKLTTPITRRDK